MLIGWVAGMMFWLLNAPYHSRIHDFWWLPLASPLALIGARASLNVLVSTSGRAAAVVLLLGFTAWMSVGATKEYLNWREHGVSPVEFGEAVRPYLHDGDTMIGWYPNEIWYTGVPGYISGMIRDEEEYAEILDKDRPALIVLASDDPAWFYQRAWDAGYVPFIVYGWVVYFRSDIVELAAADDAGRSTYLAAMPSLTPGRFLRLQDGPVFYYDWGLKMEVHEVTAVALGLESGLIDVEPVPVSVSAALPAGPAVAPIGENSVVMGLSGQKYVIRGGEKHLVANNEALRKLGLAEAPVSLLPEGLIALIPEAR
jgi:hypothetical protein